LIFLKGDGEMARGRKHFSNKDAKIIRQSFRKRRSEGEQISIRKYAKEWGVGFATMHGLLRGHTYETAGGPRLAAIGKSSRKRDKQHKRNKRRKRPIFLTTAEAAKVKKMVLAGRVFSAIIREFKCSRTTIKRIENGIWKPGLKELPAEARPLRPVVSTPPANNDTLSQACKLLAPVISMPSNEELKKKCLEELRGAYKYAFLNGCIYRAGVMIRHKEYPVDVVLNNFAVVIS
jgi:hypothetical protein